MKIAAKVARSLSDCASASSFGFSTMSTLFSTSTFGARTSVSPRRIASSSSCTPFCESIRKATTSASCVLPQALPTMARSSRRRGVKMPGVSTKISCAAPSIAMPRMSARVVCTLGVTIEILLPTSALSSVDLPAFGAPISATKPQLVACAAVSAIGAFGFDTFARHHGGGGGLLGRALGAAQAFGGSKLRQMHSDAKFRIMVRTGALNLAVSRRRQAARLRPFLQHGFGIAQRLRGGAHTLLPQSPDQRFRGGKAAVQIDSTDQRFAHVGQDRRPLTAAGIGLRRAEPNGGAEIDRARHVGARFLAYQIGQPARQFTLVGFREGAKQHVGNYQAEHVVAEEFQPLVAAGAVATALERRNMRERAVEQSCILEAIADALLKRAVATAAATRGFFLSIPRRRTGGPLGGLGGRRLLRRNDRFRFFAPCHRTRLKRRFQRTVQGQRHTSQACAPSRIEKKMICALPMMFS